MTRLAGFALVLVIGACGGKSSAATPTPRPSGAVAAKLPWEAAFTVGATFTLADETDEGNHEPLVIKVTGVDDTGRDRIYTLEWSHAGNGLTTIIVRDGAVLFGDTKLEGMQEPVDSPALGVCYGQDLSNPGGCEDVCDGHVCMTAGGIVAVDGLYAPGYANYVAH